MRVRQREREWGSVAWDDRADIQPAIFAFGAFKKLIQITRAGSALVRGRGSWAKKQENLEIRFFNILCSHHSILWPQNAHTRAHNIKFMQKFIYIYKEDLYTVCVCVCVAYVLERYVLLLAVVAVYRNTSLSIFICILEQV